MGKASLYVVYHWQGDTGHGVGQCTIETDAIYELSMRDLRQSEINMIRDKVLETVRQETPSIKTLFLSFWRWVAPEMQATA